MSFQLFSNQKSQKKKQIEIKEEKPEEIKEEVLLSNEKEFEQKEMPMTFQDLKLNQFLIDALKAISIHKPTDIQKALIPPILQGKNAIGQAATGSGKTLSFALPIVQQLSKDPYGIYAVVLTPTRELAFQIAEQFKAIGDGIHLKIAVIVGGMDMMQQALLLSKKPHIVIATPGRLRDHLQSSSDALSLKKVKFLVLDEADRLLEETFASDLNEILNALPKERQTLLLSATMTKSIQRLKSEKTFCYVSNRDPFLGLEKLDQRYIMTPSLVRDSYLIWLLKKFTSNDSEKEEKEMMIIFTGKCKSCELLRILLRNLEFNVTALHSQMTQQQRISSLARFRTGLCPILIATDVGSRGLDIPQVRLVINYDVPACATDYIHRIGRTARAGRDGKAITLMTEMDVDLIKNIEKTTNKKLEQEPVKENEILSLLKEVTIAKKNASLILSDMNFGERTLINKMKRKRKEE